MVMLELGKGCLIAKAELKDAFMIMAISPLDYRLLVFKLKGQFYFDIYLPTGCSTPYQTFESVQCIKQTCHKSATLLMALSFL